MQIKLPRYSYDVIRKRATDFLQKYHPSQAIPVPIEEIIDLNFKINIIPIPGLEEFGVNAYTWKDLKNICVDQGIYMGQENRYRFTLAHEIGHMVLHRDLFRSFDVDSIEGYLEFINSIGIEDYRWLEKHADTFAGLVLVPPRPLKEKFDEALSMFTKEHFSLEDPLVRSYISDWIGEKFCVSALSIEIRLVADDLLPYVEPKGSR
jgi:hypothetical protein